MAAIDKFKQQVHSQGILRGNRFKVKMYPPLSLMIGQDDDALERYATAVTLPGRNVGLLERSEYGEARSVGVVHEHGECSVDFILSEDTRERRYIERWQDLIFNPLQQKYGYYSNYIGKVEIHLLGHNNRKTEASYELQEAFPTSIGDLSLEYGDGTMKTMSVTFKYRRYLKTK